MNAREFMATYKSGPASERITADATGRTTQRSDCPTCGGVGAYQTTAGDFRNCNCRTAKGGDAECSTSSHGSLESSSSVDDIIAGILECLGKADGLWLSRGEIMLLIARTKGGA